MKRSWVFLIGAALAFGVIVEACVGDDPTSGSIIAPDATTPPQQDAAVGPVDAAGGDAGVVKAFPFSMMIDRIVPRDSTPVRATITIGPIDKEATVQLVNPPTGIFATATKVLPGVTEDKIEIHADTSAAVGFATLDLAAQADGFEIAHAKLRVVVKGDPGMLDPTFNDGGVFLFPASAGTSRAAALHDGRLVVGGSMDGQFALAAVLVEEGAIDPAFNAGKTVVTTIGTSSAIHALAIQADGKIVAVGSSSTLANVTQAALARYDTSGNLDTSFGDAGVTTFSVQGSSSVDALEAVAVQTDGKIVAVGSTSLLPDGGAPYGFVVARVNANGTPDPAFASDAGVTVLPFGSALGGAHDVALLGPAPEKLVVIGTDGDAGVEDFRVARLLSTGAIDPGFSTGGAGSVQIAFTPASDVAFAIRPGPLGTWYLGGRAPIGASRGYALTRLAADGRNTETARVIVRINGGGVDMCGMAMQADGKILMGGQIAFGAYPEVVRFLPDASTDPSFGTNAAVVVPGIGVGNPCSILVQPDGRILVVTYSNGGSFRMARLFP